MDPPRFGHSPDATLLDVDDPARPELDRRGRVGRRTDRLVQADVGPDPCLELRVFDQVVVVQRLFDHQQVELVERQEDVHVGERVGGVRVDRQQDAGVRRADRAHAFHVQARLDLQLDAPVPLREIAVHLREQLVGRPRDADRDAAGHAIGRRPEVFGQRSPRRAELGVQERVDQRGLGHRVAAHARQDAIEVVGRDVTRGEQRREQEPAEDEPRAVVELLRIPGIRAGHAFAPSFRVVGDHADQHARLVGLLAEARPERPDERDAHGAELDGADERHAGSVRT